MLKPRAANKGLAFLYEPAVNLPKAVHGDEHRLRQILINLLGNAIKFTQTGSVILKVSAREESTTKYPSRSTLTFAIKDTGPGIAAKTLGDHFCAI